jgi:hypothetical protein
LGALAVVIVEKSYQIHPQLILMLLALVAHQALLAQMEQQVAQVRLVLLLFMNTIKP